jgi:hypothetical protein
MKTLIELNFSVFMASCAILFWVVRYRIHLHCEYTPRMRKHRHSRRGSSSPVTSIQGKRTVGGNSGEVPPAVLADLESALQNLGCDKKEAKARAAFAAAQPGPQNFDALLYKAMQ